MKKPPPVKPDKEMFSLMLEFNQADWADGMALGPTVTYSGIEYTSVEQNLKAIPVNGLRIWTDLDAEKMRRAQPERNLVMVDCWLSSTQTKRIAERYKMKLQDFLDMQVKLLREGMKEHGKRVWWCLCGEQDGGVIWPRKMFKSRREAFEFYRDCYITNKPDRYHPLRKMANYPMMEKRYKVNFEKENIAIHVSKCFSTHYPFEWGAKLVWMEMTGTLGNAEVSTAFVRGAASQHNGYWGMDISPWSGLVDGTCFFDANGVRKAGISENVILRELVSYFYSGTNLVLLESSSACNWIKTNDGKWKLSPYGKNAKKFGKHSLLENPNRGKPHVPFAVMLEHDHGWEQRSHRIWNGLCEYTRADAMIDNFFEFVFPGCGKLPPQFNEFRQDGTEPFPPCHDRDKMRKMLWEGFDTRPYEHILSASRYGDSFNVVLEDCPLEVLKQYKVLVLLGNLKVTGNLEEKLSEYVKSGGELVVNTTQVPKKFMGVEKTGGVELFAKFFPKWKDIDYDEGPNPITLVRTSPKWKMLAEARRYNRAPSILQRKIGKGTIYLTLMPYMQNTGGRPFSPHNQDFLDHVFTSHLLISVKGPRIQYLVTKKTSSLIVTLINNSGKTWTGDIVIMKKGLNLKSGHDLWNNRKLSGHTGIKVKPYAFRILEFQT